MSTRLREAAVQHLNCLGATDGQGSVRRLSVDVEADGRTETVMLSLRNGELQCVSSDGQSDGAHIAAALRFVAGLEQRDEASPPGPSMGSSPRSPESLALEELAEALQDLLTAVTRVGVDKAQYAPSVDAALERVVAVAPRPTPPGLGRFLGRLQQELLSSEPWRVARLLEGSSQLVHAVRSKEPSRASQERLLAWLGVQPATGAGVERLYDRTMIEVGREWLHGAERASIERRYLIDVASGLSYREDRPRAASASLGPCPRELHVGLAEVEPGPAPRRIRVLQYEVQPHVDALAWERLRQSAMRSFAELTEGYRRSVQEYPSLAEPFALIAPYRLERNGVFRAFDADGHQLVLERAERRGAALAFYELLAEGVEPSWLAGRLTDSGATLCMTPFALGTQDGAYIRL